MDDDNFTSDIADDMAQSTGSKLRSVGSTAGRAVARAVGKTVKKTARRILALIGPTVGGFFAFILLLGLLFMWLFESRGTSGELTRDPAYDNPVIEQNGVPTAFAYTKQQALINAYYNYLSTISAQKYFIDPETGEEVWLRFDNTSQTSDYAGLTTTDNEEYKFYISSYFLTMVDEQMHQNAFYYPEQLIKPVFAKALPVPGSTDGKKYITTLPLIDDGSANAKALYNNLYNNGDDPLYAVTEPYTTTPKYRSEAQFENATLSKLARSAPYILSEGSTENNIYSTYSGQEQTDAEDDKVPGIWDYGFGSIIQYEVGVIDRTITSYFERFEIHVHYLEEHPAIDPETGEVIIDPETEQPVMEQEYVCPGNESINIYIDPDDTVSSLLEKIDSYNTEDTQVAISPSQSVLERMVAANGSTMPMVLLPSDVATSMTVFNDPILNKYFGNSENGHTYPLKVPLITAVATFSGSLRYEYSSMTTSTPIDSAAVMTFDSGLYDDCQILQYFPANTASCDYTAGLYFWRSGTTTVTKPVPGSSVNNGVSTYGEPLGVTYIEEYLSNYDIYVPDTVRSDLDFTNRVNAPQEGEYAPELDANGDGSLTIMDFIAKLGLMKPYEGELPPGYLRDEMFAINEFSVAEAIGNMRKISDPREAPGYLSQLIQAMADFLTNLQAQIDGMFSYIEDAFGEYVVPSYYVRYTYDPPLQNIYDTVIRAYTFTNQSKYSDENDLFEPERLDYLLFDSRGVGIGGDQIVAVANSQVGNIGGEVYWRWFGFDAHVDWCACFVSWCANECGYIDSNVIPKFANVGDGYHWFVNHDRWQDQRYTPSPGDIIFFDWDTGSGQDGLLDHVGIVEKVENGLVYTIEGNSGDKCREKTYPLGYYEIAGYGTPQW